MDVKRIRFLPVFYLLLAYVLLQFAWWAYSIVKLNERIILLESKIATSNGASSEQISEIHAIMDKKMWMVAGEGSIFLVLLLGAAFYMLRSFNRELSVQAHQRNFMLSVTHELKSPLSSVKLHLQTLLKRELPPDKQKELAGSALKESERLEKLIENILTASRIESNKYVLDEKKHNLSLFVQRSAIRLLNPSISNRTLYTEIEPDHYASFDETALFVMLSNLLENAVKYSPNSSPVSVYLRSQDAQLLLTVADKGKGISEKDKPNIFKKFYRSGNEDTRNSKGTGLGLFIVKELADLSRFTLTVSDNPGGGTKFTIMIPKESNT